MSVNLTIQLPFQTVRAIQDAGNNKTEVARNLNVDEAVINAIALLDVAPVSEGVKQKDTAVPDAAPVSDGGRFINIAIHDDRGFRKKEHFVCMHDSWSVSQLKRWIRTAGVAWHSDIVLRFGGRPLGSSKGDEWWKDQQPLSALSIALPFEAVVAIGAATGNKIEAATNAVVAAAVVGGLEVLSLQPGNSVSTAAPSQPKEYINIKFPFHGTTHLVALPSTATLTSLRNIIAAQTGRAIKSQSFLLYKKCQIGGTAGEDGLEATMPLKTYGITNGAEIGIEWA